MFTLISCAYLLLFIKFVLAYNRDIFTEELLIKPLYSEQLYAHFQFTTKWDTSPETETCRKIMSMYLSIINCIFLQLIIHVSFREHLVK